ncbi:MAG: hypothetical protein ABIA75_04300 [Candidatus Neomarinimicrobiota bacterium]
MPDKINDGYVIGIIRGKIIRIDVSTPISYTVQREFAREAIRLAQQNNLTRYLVDVTRVFNQASFAELYNFAYSDMKILDLDKTTRVAILTAPDDISHNFIETVFLNAGYNCQRFTEEAAALDWLG